MIYRGVFKGLCASIAALFAWCSVATFKVITTVVLTATAIVVPGTKGPGVDVESPSMIDAIYRQELQGWVYTQASDGFVATTYPRSLGVFTGFNDPLFDSSVRNGVANMDALFADSNNREIVGFGYSQGAAVITSWLQQHANGKDPDAPAPEMLTFVLIGNPNRPNGGLLARVPGLYVPGLGVTFNGATPESQYKVTDVIRQYDLFGDFPVDPLNVFAILNVLADAGAIHGDYLNVNVQVPHNWTEQHGNTTYVMEPANHLPLLQPLYTMASSRGKKQTPLLDAMEPVLRYIVELGYDRTNQSTPTTFQPGSSLVRFVQTLPEFAQAIKQGSDKIQGGLCESKLKPRFIHSSASSRTKRSGQTLMRHPGVVRAGR